MSIICGIFGHKSSEGIFSGGEYMRLGRWGAIDGIGRYHYSLVAQCPRCGEEYDAGKVHGNSIAEDMARHGWRPNTREVK